MRTIPDPCIVEFMIVNDPYNNNFCTLSSLDISIYKSFNYFQMSMEIFINGMKNREKSMNFINSNFCGNFDIAIS